MLEVSVIGVLSCAASVGDGGFCVTCARFDARIVYCPMSFYMLPESCSGKLSSVRSEADSPPARTVGSGSTAAGNGPAPRWPLPEPAGLPLASSISAGVVGISGRCDYICSDYAAGLWLLRTIAGRTVSSRGECTCVAS